MLGGPEKRNASQDLLEARWDSPTLLSAAQSPELSADPDAASVLLAAVLRTCGPSAPNALRAEALRCLSFRIAFAVWT